MDNQTVMVEEYTQGILLMRWQANIRDVDITTAFNDIETYLNEYAGKVSVIVDLTGQTNIPIHSTLFKSISIQNHANLDNWLVLGKNKIARMIGNTLTNMTRKDNIRWFDTFEQLQDYLATKSIENIQNA